MLFFMKISGIWYIRQEQNGLILIISLNYRMLLNMQALQTALFGTHQDLLLSPKKQNFMLIVNLQLLKLEIHFISTLVLERFLTIMIMVLIHIVWVMLLPKI